MEQITYGKGTPADCDEIVDFGNYIFSHDCGSTDFPSLLPKLYGGETNLAEYHYLAKAGGRIVGMIGAFPMEANILGRSFPARGIGTISTHPKYRGKGIMTELFRAAVSDMERDGVAFSVLGGQRQRYEHFGYEPCGVLIDFAVTKKNLSQIAPGKFSTAPLERGDAADIRRALRLQSSKPLYITRRPEDFYTTSLSWGSTPFLLLENGSFCGYLIASSDRGTIQELELTDVSRLPETVAAYLASAGVDTVHIDLPPFEREKIAILDSFCEWYQVGTAHSFYIFDYEGLIRQLMMLKATYTTLADGKLVLEIGGSGRLSIEVSAQRIKVENTDEPADLVLSPLAAARFLFSPLSGLLEYMPGRGAITSSWFPLPLYLPRIDEV